MRSLSKYIWNSGRSFSRRIILENTQFHEVSTTKNELLSNIVEWNENGSLHTNLNYLHLETLFANNHGAEFFDMYTKQFKHAPAKLLSFAKYAPQTAEGHQTLILLMTQYANIGDFDSCMVVFDWICEDRAGQIVPIEHYNTLLHALSRQNNGNNTNDKLMSAWNIWNKIKKSPISFDEETIFNLLNILKTNKSHTKQFVDDLFDNFNSVISINPNIINHILPFIEDFNVAYKRYQDNVHLNKQSLSVSMLKNILNNLDTFNQDFNLMNEHIFELVSNYFSTADRQISKNEILRISNVICQICALPKDKKEKYKFDDAANIICIFEKNETNTNYIHYLLDNAVNFDEIETILHQYCDDFDVDNLYNLVFRVFNELKCNAKQINSDFVHFVMSKHKKLIHTMSFNEARIALNTLSILNKFIINNNMQQFVSLIEQIQFQMNKLFETNSQIINSTNTKFGHKVIVYNMDEIIGMLSMFTKHRIYSQQLIHSLSEQIVTNIQINNPQYTSSINYFDECTKNRKLTKNIKTLFPIYTSLLRHLRYLNCGNRKLYALIASSLQKRPDIIRMDELREWCLCFGAMQFVSNSIWLSIQSVILDQNEYENNTMPIDMLIDFVWSMSVNDLIPNHWLIPDLIQIVNDKHMSIIDELSFVHKTRLFEICQALYASSICHKSLNLINQNVVGSLHEFYNEYVCTQFAQQCKLRPSVKKFTKFLDEKHVNYEIGGSVGNMLALCDIVLPQYKIVIDVFDYAHVTKRSQGRTREWIKFKARREMTRRLVENTQNKWHFILVDGADPDYDMDAFSRLIHKFMFAERLMNQIEDVPHRQIPEHLQLKLTE